MPVFIEWKWVEHTETFLAIFHFWDDRTKQNLRMRNEEYGYETCVYIGEENVPREEYIPIVTIPAYIRSPTKLDTYMSWAPSHAEFCLLTELLTYANLLNGLKPAVRKRIRPKLEGKALSEERKGRKYLYFLLDAELLKKMPEGSMVSFAQQEGISFEVCYQYVEYIRKLTEPFLKPAN